ncbi:MAG: peptidylprolyl isomerase [Acidimicrobiales bacterium]
MPTDKRARQRAARQAKQTELQKLQKRRKTMRRAGSLTILAALIVVVALAVGSGGSPKHHKLASGATTTTTVKPAGAVPTCPSAKESKRIVWFRSHPPTCIASTSVWDATFHTSVGTFVVQMTAAKSFAAVNNFIFLARWNYYNGTFFHRVIPGFVVQGGDPTGTGSGGPHHLPGYSFTGNTPPTACKTKPTTAGCYVPGDIAMANSSGRTTNGSQFFVVLPGGQKVLNTEPNYTNFGNVISGMAVVDKIGADGSASGTPKVKVNLISVTVKEIKA